MLFPTTLWLCFAFGLHSSKSVGFGCSHFLVGWIFSRILLWLELIMLAPFNMPRWPLAAPWLLHPSRVAFPGRHSKHWLSNLKCFTSQKLTNTRAHTLTIITWVERKAYWQGSLESSSPCCIEGIQALWVLSHSTRTFRLIHVPLAAPFVSPCDCHHTLLCFISVPFPLFLLKLSSNLHIQLSSRGDSTVSRRAVVSACCLPSCAWPVDA